MSDIQFYFDCYPISEQISENVFIFMPLSFMALIPIIHTIFFLLPFFSFCLFHTQRQILTTNTQTNEEKYKHIPR